jgi:hypothetical protein
LASARPALLRTRSRQPAPGHGAADYTFVVAVVLDIECRLDARPLPAKLRVVANGNFILRILGLRFDQIFVGAFLNMKFVVGYLSLGD